MGDKTGIQWTDATWNPVTGCSKVSPGCAHCYAETVAARFWPKQYPPIPVGNPDCSADDHGACATTLRPREFTDVQCHEDRLDQPLRWRRPRRIFVNSMSDLFHESVPDAFIDRVFAVMALAPRHTFQILTKRAERMHWYMSHLLADVVDGAAQKDHGRSVAFRLPLANVWLGVSVENQHFADERIAELVNTPAAVRFLSCEPLLAPLDLRMDGHFTRNFIHWVIVGGESGAGARPFNVAWARSIVQQCQAAGVAVFVKQLGACITGLKLDGPPFSSPPRREGFLVHWTRHEDNTFGLCDRKGGDPSEWPADMRVRELPKVGL